MDRRETTRGANSVTCGTKLSQVVVFSNAFTRGVFPTWVHERNERAIQVLSPHELFDKFIPKILSVFLLLFYTSISVSNRLQYVFLLVGSNYRKKRREQMLSSWSLIVRSKSVLRKSKLAKSKFSLEKKIEDFPELRKF